MKKWIKRAIAMVVVVDFLVALVLVQQDIIAHLTINQRKIPPSVKTLGVYAITQNTPRGNTNDVDLWVQDPQGNIVYYVQAQAGLMSLQHDVIPGITEIQGSGKGSNCDCEETVLRGTIPGTYTVNEVMYNQYNSRPEKVIVSLWKIDGVIQEKQRTLILSNQGEEVTAFRFTVDSKGKITGFNEIPKSLISSKGTP